MIKVSLILMSGLFDTLDEPRISDRATYALVTPRHLLSHTSGLPNWAGSSWDMVRTEPLEFAFEPGTNFRYSGEGYGLLQAFLEAKSNQSMEALSAALFAELGMTHSTLVGEKLQGDYARGHWGARPGRTARRTDRPVAAYSLVTNAADYSRFLSLSLSGVGVGVSPATLAEFRRPHIAVDSHMDPGEADLAWSLGWGVQQSEGRRLYFQWGDNGPFRAFAGFDPETRNGLVYFSNSSLGNLYLEPLASGALGDVSTAGSFFNNPVYEWARMLVRI